MLVTAKILDYDGERLTLLPTSSITHDLIRKQSNLVEIRLVDGREITAEQRKKIYAIMRDISLDSGLFPEEAKEYLKFWFRSSHEDIRPFSLSDVEEDIASQFIDYLIKFCLRWDVPTKVPLIEYCDDIDHYLWYCLYYRKCAIYGMPADVHHVDRIGMGRDRERIVHEGLRAIALCRRHHHKAHQDQRGLFEQYHIYGIPLDKRLCDRLKLRKEDSA